MRLARPGVAAAGSFLVAAALGGASPAAAPVSETDLDVEYAHAIAPGASILVVETPTSENEGTTGFPQIVAAEKYVIDHHLGGVISQSFSATELTFPSKQSLLSLRGAYIDAAGQGVTVLGASGDSGAADVRFNQVTYYLHPATSWPDSDPLVTGVGGTQLHLSASGRDVRPATVWNDTYNAATSSSSATLGRTRWRAAAAGRSTSVGPGIRAGCGRSWAPAAACPTSR
jgi:subtilase family serine protease